MARTRQQSASNLQPKTLHNQSTSSTQTSTSKRTMLIRMYEMEKEAILNEYCRRRNQIGKSIGHSDRRYSEFISKDTKSLERASIFIDCQPESISYSTPPKQKMDESSYQQPVEQVSAFDIDSSNCAQPKVGFNPSKHLEIELPHQIEVCGSKKNVRSQQSPVSTNNLEIGLLCRSQINDKVNLEAIQISRSNSAAHSQRRYGSIKYRSEASKRLQRESKLIERSIKNFGFDRCESNGNTFKLSRHWKVVVWTIRCCNGAMIANVGFSFLSVIIPRHYQVIRLRNSRNGHGHRISTIARVPGFTLMERSCNGHKVLGIFNDGLVKQNNCFNYSVNGGKC